jgi:hypothetical protein
VRLTFRGELIYWRGPSPFHFVEVPGRESERIHDVAPSLTYGWGCIPASVKIGSTSFTTALFPKDGAYLVPVKVAVRNREGIELGDVLTLTLDLGDQAAPSSRK